MREGNAQARRRDRAIDLHCQSEETINNIVTIKTERWREREEEGRRV